MGTESQGVVPAGGDPVPVEPIPAADAIPPAADGVPGRGDMEEITWLEANRAQQRAATQGYIHKRRIYALDFDDPALAGLVVKARSVSLGRFIALIKLAVSLERLDDGALTLTAADADAIEGLFTGLGDALVSWTLLDPDTEQPVPATRDGLMDQDADFAMMLVDAWMTAIGGVAAPLGGSSTSGPPSPVASIPMVERSPNP